MLYAQYNALYFDLRMILIDIAHIKCNMRALNAYQLNIAQLKRIYFDLCMILIDIAQITNITLYEIDYCNMRV